MLKASALYLVIIIALVIGVLCSSLIVAAYFYRIEYQKKFRYDQLQNNVNSGVNILLAGDGNLNAEPKVLSLFNGDADSVSLKKVFWGLYDVGVARAFIQRDTLTKVFSMANVIDSGKWAALYLIDEDRPMSLSGNTTIKGDAYIPKGGVTTAYVDGKAYQGDNRLIIGTKKNSKKKLPELSADRLKQFEQLMTGSRTGDSSLMHVDSIGQSFLLPTRVFNFKKHAQTIGNIKLSGNIILLSDTTITFEKTAILNNIMVFARGINVKEGFNGNCQLFATDSVTVEKDCRFNYPSGIGILAFSNSDVTASQVKVSFGENSLIEGTVFTYQKTETATKPIIRLAKQARLTGEIYSQGWVSTKDSVHVSGSLFTGKFLYQSSFTLFENYLINVTINSKELSPYYLTSDLMPVASKKKKVLQWLETN